MMAQTAYRLQWAEAHMARRDQWSGLDARNGTAADIQKAATGSHGNTLMGDFDSAAPYFDLFSVLFSVFTFVLTLRLTSVF